SPPTVRVLLGNGDGSFQAPITIITTVDYPRVKVADFNSDGRPDLLVSSVDGGSSPPTLLLGNGDGSVVAPIPVDTGCVYYGPLEIADVNSDGRPDLLVLKENSGFYSPDPMKVLLGNGDGTFQAPILVYLGFYEESTPSLEVTDVNGDGRPDL